ncbi:hypothetical protein E2C01_007195 [Portunus trituberculatus]|uniref:Uncharacterized protein n=1 Tax=Portunus trituberculatus TaxID=210409 RepID=A0A5B7CYI5_PORTR|nr:hypothetical protein [Portunus trituberculatus]
MSHGSRVVCRVAAKFELKSPSMHSMVCGHPTTKSEFRQAEICQVWGPTLGQLPEQPAILAAFFSSS